MDGVYPVGSQLPTEHELCERFSVSRYTVREALRRLREDNLVSSRPRAGTLVVPRSTSDSYDVMSINDLVAFATEARFAIESMNMVTLDDELAARTGLDSGEEWLAVRGFRQAEGAGLPAVQDRVLHQPRIRRDRQAPAAPYRPDLPADRGPVRREHRRGASGDRRGGDFARCSPTASRPSRASPALEVQRTYKTSDGEIAQVTVNTHPASRFRHSMTMRRVRG